MLPLYHGFVCVRVTDMRGVDLSRYVFDFDLTFTALMMNADGTIYHRYGSRDHQSADKWLSSPSLEFVLQESLRDHAEHSKNQTSKAPRASFAFPGSKNKPVRMEEIPAYQKRDQGKCIHCHSIHPAFYESALAVKKWQADDKWVYPSPDQIGLEMDRDQQRLILAVSKDSPADQAGLQRGDQLLQINRVSIASVSDLMFALDTITSRQRSVDVKILRSDKPLSIKMKLRKDWKVGTPASFAWRPFKWGLTPAPGFGGPQLGPEELREIGLDPKGDKTFAFRVQYLVTWNENKRYGLAARQAGLRQGDIVLSLDGKSDFDSVEHFHSWWRLTRKVGKTVRIEILRQGKRQTLRLRVIE